LTQDERRIGLGFAGALDILSSRRLRRPSPDASLVLRQWHDNERFPSVQ
jgi:hypothetical protein